MKFFKPAIISVIISFTLLSCTESDCDKPSKKVEVKFDTLNLSYYNYKYNSIIKCKLANKDTITLYATDTIVGTSTYTDAPYDCSRPVITYTNDVKSVDFFTSKNKIILGTSYVLVNETTFKVQFNMYYSYPANSSSSFEIKAYVKLDTFTINNKTYTDVIKHMDNSNKVFYSKKFGILQIIKDENEIFSLL